MPNSWSRAEVDVGLRVMGTPQVGQGFGRGGEPAMVGGVPGMTGCAAGVIAMASGPLPTLIAVPGVSVATSMGVTVPSAKLTTYAVLPSGVIAMARGSFPTLIAVPGVLVATLMGVTVLSP